MFQSLFCWISFLDDFISISFCSELVNVSILVLLDFLFGRFFNKHIYTPTYSFNPCFAGFPFWTEKMQKHYQNKKVVSILVLLDFLFGLFITYILFLTFIVVSILVLLDFLFGQSLNMQLENQGYKFQSLFCWISFLDDWYTWMSIIFFHVSFNPCFAGFPFWTCSKASARKTVKYMFQSLFCWISFLDYYGFFYHEEGLAVSILVLLDFLFGLFHFSVHARVHAKFQSLFCWISFLDDTVFKEGQFPRMSFNPCFAGFPFWTINIISILSTSCYSFNPCFAGFPFWTPRRFNEIMFFLLVSILVLLDFLFGR